MDVMEIPFVGTVGITKNSDGVFALPYSGTVHNHLKTVHAAAQYALAETASGDTLLALFPDLEGKVVPVLRDSKLKFKRPAETQVTAFTEVIEDDVARFREQLSRRGRSTIGVGVKVCDEAGDVTCYGTFVWYVQTID